MKKRINTLALIAGLGVIAWGIFLVVVTELTAPEVWYGPGIFGPYAGRVGGIILILTGVVGIIGSFVSMVSPFLAGCFFLLVSINLTLAISVTFISPYVFLNIALVGIFYTATWSSIKASDKK
jgi:hypothetical protein